MTLLARIRVSLTGSAVVGPSLMTFYQVGEPSGLPAAVKTFVTACADRMPTGISFDVPNSGDRIVAETGVLDSGWSGTGGGTVASGNTTGYALGAGGVLAWKTAAVSNGYHVQGRTFIVPLAHNCFDGGGRVDALTVQRLTDAGTALIAATSGGLCVWSRPMPQRPGKNGTLPARAGVYSAITTARMLTTPSALRSRRV